MRCPICGRATWEVWQHSDGRRFISGVYGCAKCGCMKIDQRIHQGGERSVVTVVPECLVHGTDPVVYVSEGRYRCTVCECEISLEDGVIHRSHPIDLVAIAVV